MYNLKLVNGEISLDEAKKMVAAYNRTNPGKTKSVWFGLDRVENLLKYLQEEKASGMGTNGLRIYFGQYPSDLKDPPAYAGKDTVIFISTMEKDGKTVDYYTHTPPKATLPENKGEICPPPSDCGNNGSLLLDPATNEHL